ncbi:nectin-3-like protein isoform X1 [Xenopus laevis]|uniref:Nectin-3-like protein isoform X1 n=3 Tax=Xenopus laevis TaxID=8355 RepID=A0A8J1MCH9_XENLA|nr:nectin-3-like protein isoform X1 [Xenopus laevis]
MTLLRQRCRLCLFLLLILAVPATPQVSVIVDGKANAKLGSDTKLYCRVETLELISQITWQRKLSPNNENFLTYSKGEEPLHLTPFGERVRFLGNGDLGGSILIPNVTLADEGTYLCIYTTFPSGTKEGEIHLSIWVEPSVEVQLNPVLLGPNPDIIAQCVAFASRPAANIKWHTNGFQYTSKETPTQHSNGTVTVQSQLWMTPSLGLYGHQATCLVSLPDQIFEKEINFSITNIQYAPQTVHVRVHRINEDLPLIECWADGNPPANYTWRRENGSIPDDVAQVKGNLLEHTDDNGLYVCEATNSIGRNSHSVYLYKYTGAIPRCYTGVCISVSLLAVLVILCAVCYYIWEQRNKNSREGEEVQTQSGTREQEETEHFADAQSDLYE